jgi:hypothetical protein
MKTFTAATKEKRLKTILDSSWDILFQRIATGRVKLNEAASLPRHYAAILRTYGRLLCMATGETFTIAVEPAGATPGIDITCALGEIRAAVALDCFRKQTRRAPAAGMLKMLQHIDRLLSQPDFSLRKFVCLTDDPSYANASCPGSKGSLPGRAGGKYARHAVDPPSGRGVRKGGLRDRPAAFAEDIEFEWSNYKQWYFLAINL